MYNPSNLYSFRKLIVKKTTVLSLKNKIIIVFRVITLTHKVFQFFKNILIRFNLLFNLNTLKSNKIKIEFNSVTNLKQFFNVCYMFKIIPYFLIPSFLIYNTNKISFSKFYNYLNNMKIKLDIYKLVLKKLCRNLLIKIFFLNLKLLLKKCQH